MTVYNLSYEITFLFILFVISFFIYLLKKYIKYIYRYRLYEM